MRYYMRCLITGGAGFIGSCLCRELKIQGHEVKAIDNLSNGKRDNLRWAGVELDFEKCSVQTLSLNLIDTFIRFRPQWVFHLAALPRVQFSIKEPMSTNDANICGTLNMLELSRKWGVEKFIYSSSSSAYGDQPTLPLVETMPPNPLSPYALQKLTGELYTNMYYNIHGLKTISLRYFNVYGPRQDPRGSYAAAIPKFILQSLKNEDMLIYGDGLQTRDFTFVGDVVAANIAAASCEKAEAFGQTFNVGNGNQISVKHIAETIVKQLNSKSKIKHTDPVVESKHTRADLTKIQNMLDWSPEKSFENGLLATIDSVSKLYS